MQDIIKGRIPACKLVQAAVERQMRDLKDGPRRGLVFREDQATHALEFFDYLRHSKGKWAGDRFDLEPWQQFVISTVFGWYVKKTGARRFHTVYEEIPRKNGKSTKLAGIGLKLFCADDEPGAEVYSVATKRDQAKIIFNEAKRMARKSEELSGVIDIFTNNLSMQDGACKFEPLGRDSDSMDGLNISGGLIDELHAHKTRDVWDVIETAMGSRDNYLLWAITTAGVDQESICYEVRSYAIQVLEQVIEDDSLFVFIATMDEGDDWREEITWQKANPNYGVSVSASYLKEKCQAAQKVPAKQNAFLRLHLNKWTQQVNRWLDLAMWDANGGLIREEDVKGLRCYGGLDLSSVSDMTALARVFDMGNGVIGVLMRFWVPESKLVDTHNRYRQQYETWHRLGFLSVTPGNSLDYEAIEAEIVGINDTTTFNPLHIDIQFQGHQMEQRLREQHGVDMMAMRTGMISMSPPTKELERLLLNHKVRHGNNPVLRWMADNVAVKTDHLENIMPSKASSQGKIDGIVAIIMALNGYIYAEDGQSKYEEGTLVGV